MIYKIRYYKEETGPKGKEKWKFGSLLDEEKEEVMDGRNDGENRRIRNMVRLPGCEPV